MSMVIRWLGVLVWVVWAGVGVAQESDPGEGYFQRGQFELAVQEWEKARAELDPEKSPEKYIDLSVNLAVAYQSLGRLKQALYVLQPVADKANDSVQLAKVLIQLGEIFLAMPDKSSMKNQSNEGDYAIAIQACNSTAVKRNVDKARDCLEVAINKVGNDNWLKATAKNSLGNVLVAQQKYCEAVSQYEESISSANKAGDNLLAVNTSINLIQSLAMQENCQVKQKLEHESVLQRVNKLPPSHDKAFALISLAKLAKDLPVPSSEQALREALTIAEGLNDKSALAYAKLYLTELQKNLCLSGENEKADCEKKAQTTAEGLNNKNALDYAKLYLDDLCSSWKDQKADCDKKAQTIAKGLNDKNALAYYAKLYFAKLCLSRGNPKEDCYKEAQTIEKGLNDKSASAYAKLYLADLCLSGENKGADCYFESVNLLEDAIAKDAQSYPKLKQGGQITNADSFVSSSFGFYWPPSSKVTPEQEKCKEVCKVYSSPCVQDKLPKECKEVCRDVTPLFLRDYHPELSFRLAWQLGKVYKAQYDTEKQRDAETQGKIQKDVDSDGQTRLQKAFDAKWREQLQKAMEAYDSASDYLQLVRRDYGSISKKFGVESENFYLDRADLLIQAAKVATEDDGKQNLLKSAIDSIESRQEAGLRNYFQDECVTEKSLKGEERRLQDNEALVYLVMFGNRIESVLKFSDGNMQQETSECKCNNLSQQIETLRTGLANRYRAPRVDLGFSGLISKLIITKSFQEKLSNFRNKIDTLLIVPSGELLRIPFAALLVGDPGKEPYPNEKEPYLVQHYAIAVLPSWKLSSISPSAIDLKQDSALLAGLIIEPPLSKMEIEQPKEKIDEPKVCQQRSNAVETNRDDSRSVCAKPLCYVGKEITEIEGIIQNQNRTTLLGANFTVGKVEGILKNKDYSVIHFSTHGYFDKNSQNSWLCTYNKGETLTLDRLEELLQGKQAKLLTLSACETALGAELGLAGIGVKVGTQSALGSLWSVDDESTALLMQKFYENLQEKNLKNNGYSIAKALQRAQLDLLGDEEAKSTTADNFKIPFYWAGYLLIGNWQNK